MHTRQGRQDAVYERSLRRAAQPIHIKLRPDWLAAFCRFVICSSTGRGRSSQSATGAVQAVHHVQVYRAMRDAIKGHAPMMTTSNSSSVERASLSHGDARLVGLLLHPTAFVLLWASQQLRCRCAISGAASSVRWSSWQARLAACCWWL